MICSRRTRVSSFSAASHGHRPPASRSEQPAGERSIIHGDDDQIVPIGPSAHASSKLVKRATLKIYPGGSHRLADTHKDQLNADLPAFLKS